MSFCRETERTARKEHVCSLCGAAIKKGEKYIDHADNMDDENYVCASKECMPCQPVKREFIKSDYADEGYCAEYLQEWWLDIKCYDCTHKSDECCEMTHPCRCEKYESRA